MQSCFNLVIENLLISTTTPFRTAASAHTCFNLVIENLLISTVVGGETPTETVRFQSRNRESSNFNGTSQCPSASLANQVSIS